ncbi:MAG: hypothetical protein ABGY28_00525, partial [bacterium]
MAGAIEAYLGDAGDLVGLTVVAENVSTPAVPRIDIVITDVSRALFTNAFGQLGDALTDAAGNPTGQDGAGLGEFPGCGTGSICPGDEVGADGFSATFTTASGDVVFDRNNVQIVAQEVFDAEGVVLTGARQDRVWVLWSIRFGDVAPLSPSHLVVRQGGTVLAEFDLVGDSAVNNALDVTVANPLDGALTASLVPGLPVPANCGNGSLDPGEQCDDGNAANGDCCSTTCAFECSDGNPCTFDNCIPAFGQCSHSPVAGACNDGDLCTVGDTCLGGQCVPGEVVAVGCEQVTPSLQCVAPCLDPVLGPVEKYLGDATDVAALPILFGNVGSAALPRFDIVMANVPRDLFTNVHGSFGDQLTDSTGQGLVDGQGAPLPGIGLGEDPSCSPPLICAGDEVGLDGFEATFITPTETIVFDANNVQIVAQENLDPVSGDLLGASQDLVWVLWSIRFDEVAPLSPSRLVISSRGVRLASFRLEGDASVNNAQGVTAVLLDEGCVADSSNFPVAELCDDLNGCTDDACDTVTHACTHSNNIVSCDDSDACTTADTCAAGACVGGVAPVCDDGQFCTGVESCDTILGCVDNADPLADDGVACTADSCDEINDVIVNAVDDVFCDDGEFCTGVETCDASHGCVDNADPMIDDGVACTDDSCDEAADVIVNAVNDAFCDDGQFCTGVESCDQLLGCQDNANPDPNDGVACTVDSCDESTDSLVNITDDSFCDDGQFCTGVETCDASLDCQDNADPVANDDVACTDDSCDEINDVIVNAVNDGNCDDGLYCTGVETCDAVADCQDNADPDPDDGVACTVDSCDEATDSLVNSIDDAFCDDGNGCTDNSCDAATGCELANNEVVCNDGNACTTGDVCAAGSCAGVDTSLSDCEDGNLCTTDSCDAATGCANVDNSVSCDDSDACTTIDTCMAGACVGGPRLECGDANGCTDDFCNSLAGCVNAPNVAACDDGDACTTTDTCAASACVGGAAPDCDDANGCTDDTCDSATGCINANNAASCDDANACTTADTCSAGACVGGVAPVCDDELYCTGVESCDTVLGCVDNSDPLADDGVACTDDSCDELNDVIVNAVNDGNCDDGLYCTGVETCDASMGCQDNADPMIDDGVACTDDSCDEAADVIVNAANDGSCDDGLYCTGVETCHATMGCQDNADPVIDDGVACTDDSCDEAGDVIVNAVNDGSCDDGLYCTGVETCDASMGCMDNADPMIDDGVTCTDDSCDEDNDVIVNAVNDGNCDDGLYCTGVESCDASMGCQDNADPMIDDGVVCTDDSCDELSDVIV